MKSKNKIIFISCFVFFFLSCSEGFKKTPLDKLMKEFENSDTYSIILDDMNKEGIFFDTFKHKYKIISEKSGKISEKLSPWYEVEEKYFKKYIENLGMELASKGKDGKINKSVSPPGFANYVGNGNYGHWVGNGGSSFWEFYGKFAMLQTVFGLMDFPSRRNSWKHYRKNYYGKKKPYYGYNYKKGKVSSRSYGVGSSYYKKKYSSSKWNSKSSNRSFQDKVNNRVSRSSSNSRSSSRYSGGSSSSRSRSGGSGK